MKTAKQLKEYKTLNRLVVNRNRWRTGEGEGDYATGLGDTQLLNYDGYMCCLGFACLQAGVPKQEVLDKSSPGDVIDGKAEDKVIIPKFSKNSKNNGNTLDTALSNAAIRINDDTFSTPEEKEKKLKSLFGKHGIDLVFTGNYYTDYSTGKKRKVKLEETI